MNSKLFVFRFILAVLCVTVGLVVIPALISARSNEAVFLGFVLIPVLIAGVYEGLEFGNRFFNSKESS